MGLNVKEQAYFENIVAFDHAKTSDEKELFLQRILNTRNSLNIQELKKDQYTFFSNWYIPVIRELVTSDKYTGDPAWLADQIIPAITVSKARKAVELLESLGLIQQDKATGHWHQTDSVISTPPEVHSIAVAKHTKSIFLLGKEAVDRFDASERDLRGITIGITKDAYPELKARFESFWKELLAFGQKQQMVDQVFQINLGLFPVSKIDEEGK